MSLARHAPGAGKIGGAVRPIPLRCVEGKASREGPQLRHLSTRRQFIVATAAGAAGLMLARSASAAQETLELGLQTGGTASWEIDAMRHLGLLEKQGIDLVIRPLADSAAGQVALLGGAVDLILSDLVWVSGQRARGAPLLFVPFSLTVGGVLAGKTSGIEDVKGLKGQTIGVGGGPLDKNLVFLKAYYKQQTGKDLLSEVTPKYGAPPLINQLLERGQVGAALNFWQWNARAVRAGARQLISVAGMLAEMGVATPPPLLGWTFTEDTAAKKGKTLVAFLNASFDTKDQLKTNDDLWKSLRDEMNVGSDDGLFIALRDAYRAGIVTRYDAADTKAAEAAYALLARFGGAGVVGDAPALPTAIFWKGFSR
jgi:NitT/TauT family transport system substrate-binding protein